MPADGTAPHGGWVTKRELARHLKMTTRWIEQQQSLGMPFLPCGRSNRYNIPEVEAWLREHYRSARHLADAPAQGDAVEAEDRPVREPAGAAPRGGVSSVPIGAAERSS
jgi:alkylhydroperoxidase family enzyme